MSMPAKTLQERAERIASELDDHNANLDRKARNVIRELIAECEKWKQSAITMGEHEAKASIERDALRTQVDAWIGANSPGGWIDALRAQVAELSKDAERYRWLLSDYADSNIQPTNGLSVLVYEAWHRVTDCGDNYSKAETDAAIDAAIAAQKGHA